MAKTPSKMLPLGTSAPFFALPDVVSGQIVHFDMTSKAPAFVIMFICNHCPYVKYVNKELTRLANDYQARGVVFYAINSNDTIQYPDDSPANMKQVAKEECYPFPYLFDESQEVAHAYQAACTPDFFVFDEQHKLVYRGQLDDSRPGNEQPITGESIRCALDKVLNKEGIVEEQKPSLGCNIKWKPE